MRASTKPKRIISIFMLAMFNISVMVSLRNLPLVAELGYEAIFLFILVAIFFFIPSALISAELATGWSQSGGIYIWVREAFGTRWGFFAIWIQWAHNITWYPTILSFVAGTLSYLFFPRLAENKFFIQAIILFFFWGITLLNYKGIKTSSLLSTIGVLVGTIFPGLFIILLACIWISTGNPLQLPFTPEKLLPDFSNLNQIVFLGGLFLAFAGSEVSASYAGEVKNPQKNYPRSILFAAFITLVFFLFGSLSIFTVIPENKISLVTGLMETLQAYLSQFGILWLLPLIGILLISGAFAEVNSWIIGSVKALHKAAIQGNLPPIFHRLNRHDTPTHLLLFQAIVVTISSFIILFMPSISAAYWIMSAISAQIYLVMYILMFLSAIRLRYTHYHIHRDYHIPYPHKGIWLVASLGIFSCIFAIIVSFIPPAQIKVGNIYFYESLLITGFLFMTAVPLLIFQCRKPHWKLERK